MNALFDRLMKILAKHIGLYKRLAEVMALEQAALIDMDLERIRELAKEKETTALKIKMLVPAVAQTIMDAARDRELPPDPLPTLADLAARAPEPYARPLARAGQTLAGLKRGIGRQSQANHAFVQEALDLVSGSIAILTGATLRPGHAYNAAGRKAPASGHHPVRLSREV
jgi:hypothetical protein